MKGSLERSGTKAEVRIEMVELILTVVIKSLGGVDTGRSLQARSVPQNPHHLFKGSPAIRREEPAGKKNILILKSALKKVLPRL